MSFGGVFQGGFMSGVLVYDGAGRHVVLLGISLA